MQTMGTYPKWLQNDFEYRTSDINRLKAIFSTLWYLDA